MTGKKKGNQYPPPQILKKEQHIYSEPQSGEYSHSHILKKELVKAPLQSVSPPAKWSLLSLKQS